MKDCRKAEGNWKVREGAQVKRDWRGPGKDVGDIQVMLERAFRNGKGTEEK